MQLIYHAAQDDKKNSLYLSTVT